MPTPSKLTNQINSGQLTIDWDDGTQQVLSHLLLRSHCQCADCKKWQRDARQALVVSPEIRLTGIEPVGHYGLQLHFSDGHKRGIYPWPYLRGLSEVPEPTWER
ncbi:DUF971 family protein [Herbaspirillum sp. Sphag1AN]|uniref:gamma-butyrobetaine hydroxylase-like domain-containing protein n=1 Tax=unclassified Herbaspirillum TaxID=2624150 RepID=UPI00160E468E|nr:MULTISPECIES: DUF971 domain-containing protein [unclassified Herbaspirillum]MBB3211845.1 DUF971 family protein [Herbaspirillum sp. Sphag1AN]MBB3244321.1 DUF971 family protein [Herbaspirillum sp. Sphag64]